MPTRTATLGRERTLATLARRLYRIEGEGRAELQRRAEAALLAANPRLHDASGFRSGASVVVPAVAGLQHTEEVSQANVGGEGLAAEAVLWLQALEARVEERFERATERRRDVQGHLDDQSFNTEARKALPESVKHIDRTRERLHKAEEESEAARQRLRKAIALALDGANALEALYRKAGPK